MALGLGLYFNPNITWEIIQNNPDKRWNFNYFLGNPNMTLIFLIIHMIYLIVI